ncbi:MAG: 3'-5' exonuclease [Paraclostridium sp.]
MNNLTEEQIEIINCKDEVLVINAKAGCVDSETEFFNGFGWKKISEYSQGDMVLQFNKDWTSTLVYPKRYIKADCKNMHRIKTNYGIDMVLSDEHNVIYVDISREKDRNKFGIGKLSSISASDMINRHMSNKTGFSGKFITTFNSITNLENPIDMTDDEIKLSIAIMADSNITENGKIRINIKKERKKIRLEEILNSVGIEYKKVNYNPKDLLFSTYIFDFKFKEKKFPHSWMFATRHQKELIIDEIKHWDGTERVGNRMHSYFSTNKSDIDIIQMIAHSIGIKANYRVDDRVGEDQTSSNGKIYKRKSISYELNFSSRIYAGIGQQSKVENRDKVVSEFKTVDGFKYCFEVDSSMLILRRNGKIFITGNSGKSSTMVEWAKARPNMKILYLIFGRSMADEAKVLFKSLKNVDVKTTHSLAYKGFGSMYRHKLTQSYRAMDCMKDLGLNRDYETANDVLNLFNNFLSSDAEKIDEYVVERLKGFGMKNEGLMKKLSQLCLALWNQSCDLKDDTKVTHDFYLKLYQLSSPNLGNEYDCIITDECQDLTHITVSILNSTKCKHKVILGDRSQAVYGFRNCINIMDMMENATFLELNGSFRVGQKIADMSNLVLNIFNGMKPSMKGYNQNQRIYSSKCLSFSNMQGKFNIIARTNATILAHALEASSRGMWLYFEGGVKSYPFQFYKDLYWFRATNNTKNRELKKFKDWKELSEYAEEAEDVELLNGIKFINIYGKKFDSLPHAIDNVFNYVADKKEHAQFCYCTAHKSKGLTFTDPVLIENDFPEMCDWMGNLKMIRDLGEHKQEKDFLQAIEQEVNLLYVAMTRAKGDIYLNDDMCKFFNLE